jgi:preprotein translocase subunit YajC
MVVYETRPLLKANLEFWMTAGIFTLTLLAAVQRFLQWREQRRQRQLHEEDREE